MWCSILQKQFWPFPRLGQGPPLDTTLCFSIIAHTMLEVLTMGYILMKLVAPWGQNLELSLSESCGTKFSLPRVPVLSWVPWASGQSQHILSQALLQIVLQDENFVSKAEFQEVEKKLVVSNGLWVYRLLIFPCSPRSLWLSRVLEYWLLRVSSSSSEDRISLHPGFCVALWERGLVKGA